MAQLTVLDTVFDAPIAEVCTLSLSVNLHLDSMTHHREKVVAGRTTGRFIEGDVVTWQARHFGLPLRLTVRIFDVDAPHSFADEQVRGPFAAYHHEHLFTEIDGRTHMQDRLTFAAPSGHSGVSSRSCSWALPADAARGAKRCAAELLGCLLILPCLLSLITLTLSVSQRGAREPNN